ncbi:MAG: hypothetical protein J6S58_05215 [Lentisphaeria bacterium]|nr:hypothetical protein [Lentisphaeria bacterium]
MKTMTALLECRLPFCWADFLSLLSALDSILFFTAKALARVSLLLFLFFQQAFICNRGLLLPEHDFCKNSIRLFMGFPWQRGAVYSGDILFA